MSFVVNSPNHPVFEDEPDSSAIVGEDKLLVTSGSSIPGIPQHQANLGIDFSLNDRFELGADVVVRSGVYLRGDEANLLDRTDGYAILNLRGAWHVSDNVMLFARVENVFDEDYETFGLLGEPGEVFAGIRGPALSRRGSATWGLGRRPGQVVASGLLFSGRRSRCRGPRPYPDLATSPYQVPL